MLRLVIPAKLVFPSKQPPELLLFSVFSVIQLPDQFWTFDGDRRSRLVNISRFVCTYAFLEISRGSPGVLTTK